MTHDIQLVSNTDTSNNPLTSAESSELTETKKRKKRNRNQIYQVLSKGIGFLLDLYVFIT